MLLDEVEARRDRASLVNSQSGRSRADWSKRLCCCPVQYRKVRLCKARVREPGRWLLILKAESCCLWRALCFLYFTNRDDLMRRCSLTYSFPSASNLHTLAGLGISHYFSGL